VSLRFIPQVEQRNKAMANSAHIWPFLLVNNYFGPVTRGNCKRAGKRHKYPNDEKQTYDYDIFSVFFAGFIRQCPVSL
jgi:hypothetical protein